MTRCRVVVTMLVCGLVGCSGSKDKDGGSAGTSTAGGAMSGSGAGGAAAGSNAASGIPSGPVPVTLPVVKAPHATLVTSAETFVAIDSAGRVTIGPVAPGPTPYAGTRLTLEAARGETIRDALAAIDAAPAAGAGTSGSGSGASGSGASGSGASGSGASPSGSAADRRRAPGPGNGNEVGVIGQFVDGAQLHARLSGPGPIDTLVLADAQFMAATLVEWIGSFKDRRTGIAVRGPHGLARLDLLMIDRWAPPEAVHISLGGTTATIARSYDAVRDAPKIPVATLGAELGKLVEQNKGTPTFVVLTIDSNLRIGALIAALETIVETGVTEIDIVGPEILLHGDVGTPGGGGFGWGNPGAGSGSGVELPMTVSPMTSFEVNGDETDKTLVRRYMRRFGTHVRRCYEKRLEAIPTLTGTVRVNLVIVANGGSEKVTADGLDPEVDTCVRDAFKKVMFPKPHSGGALVVEATYAPAPPKP